MFSSSLPPPFRRQQRPTATVVHPSIATTAASQPPNSLPCSTRWSTTVAAVVDPLTASADALKPLTNKNSIPMVDQPPPTSPPDALRSIMMINDATIPLRATIHPSIDTSINPSIHLSIYRYIRPSICQYINPTNNQINSRRTNSQRINHQINNKQINNYESITNRTNESTRTKSTADKPTTTKSTARERQRWKRRPL